MLILVLNSCLKNPATKTQGGNMKSKLMNIAIFCVIFIISIFQILYAQQIRADKKKITEDKAAIMDDRHDVDRLSDLIIKWDRLRKGSDQAALDRVEAQISAELRNDLKESRQETGQAQKEVMQSAAEANRSKKELRRERRDMDFNKKALKKDKRDLRKDKRDLKDDIKDSKKAEEILQKKRVVARELIGLQKQIDMPGNKGDKAMQKKQQLLLEQYLKLSQQEIQMGIRELREDQQELREDRREVREDRK